MISNDVAKITFLSSALCYVVKEGKNFEGCDGK